MLHVPLWATLRNKTQLTKMIEIEKKIWTHEDFEIMGWHDNKIYGFAIEKGEEKWSADLLFDIDYIFKWNQPVQPQQTFTFWISPCTLIFKETFDLHINITTDGGCLDLLEIVDISISEKIEQEKNKFIYEWTIELQQGQIKLKSYGFEQVVRQEPIHIGRQALTFEERGGICFSRDTY
jgi:hypothetical protein